MVDLWVVSVVAFSTIGAIVAIVYQRTVSNSRRINVLEISHGRLEEIPHIIEKHEEREDKQFQRINETLEEIGEKLVKIAIDVAVIKKNNSTPRVR